MKRRAFLQACLAAGASAPFVRFGSLMPMVRRSPAGVIYLSLDNLDLGQFGNHVPHFETTWGEGPITTYPTLTGGIWEIADSIDVTSINDSPGAGTVYSYEARGLILGPFDSPPERILADGKEFHPSVEPWQISKAEFMRKIRANEAA